MKDIKTYNAEGLQEGYYETYHKNGQLHETGTLVDSQEEGRCVEYYPNGQLRCDLMYVKGNITGRYIEYHEDGSLWCYAFMDKNEEEIGYAFYDYPSRNHQKTKTFYIR